MTERLARQIRMQAYRDYREGRISLGLMKHIVAWTRMDA